MAPNDSSDVQLDKFQKVIKTKYNHAYLKSCLTEIRKVLSKLSKIKGC